MTLSGLRPRLVVMARAPEVGRVKTRLARDIGAVAATQFYRQTLADTVRRLRDERRWRLELAVSPDIAPARAHWPRHCRITTQGGGDLGARMARLLKTRAPGATVIVGTDIPGIAKSDIAAAFHALSGHDAVFGPAEDGGYWLIGMRSGAVHDRLFAHVRWSTEHSLEDTLANIGARRVTFLRRLADVDTGADYRAWLSGRGARRN